MKKSNITPPTLLNVITGKDNSIGDKEAKKNRCAATEKLNVCKCQEQQKLSNGYIWVTNGKTSKLIHPDKLECCLSEGFNKPKH